MTSYLASLSSHYTNLKRLIPTSLSPESDASCNDANETHVTRVLRAYYTEKGRPFPPWLGQDPNAPARPTPAYTSQQPTQSGVPTAPAVTSIRTSRPGGASGLDDLFGDSSAPAAPPAEEPLSLRSRRGGPTANLRTPGYKGGASDSIPYPSRPSAAAQAEPSQPMARPLPSQRIGSYQSRNSNESSGRVEPVTAQNRLRARLGGSRAASPGISPGSGSGFGDASRLQSSPFDMSGSGGFSNTSTSSRRGEPSPYMGASSPWMTGDTSGGQGGGDRRYR